MGTETSRGDVSLKDDEIMRSREKRRFGDERTKVQNWELSLVEVALESHFGMWTKSL
jgi:hypothetical protein